MNIGGRITKRLKDLQWERADLLSRLPELSPQALSNLIVRDSKRSEWDVKIADALGVSVMWLVYGVVDHAVKEPDPPPYHSPPSNDELFLLRAYRAASEEAKQSMLYLAKTVLPPAEDFDQRTGTH